MGNGTRRMTNKRRNRKIRRNARKKLKHGKNAAPKHKLKAGRTGSVHRKKTKS